MLMNNVMGRVLAIWLVTGRWVAALFLLAVEEGYYFYCKRKRAYKMIPATDATLVNPASEYRI